MILNEYGKCVYDFWEQIPKFYKDVFLDVFVIMPNHIHGIVVIDDNVGTKQFVTTKRFDDNVVETEQCSVSTANCSVPKKTKTTIRKTNLSQIIKSFKEVSIKTIRKKYNNFDFAWQRSFYDHIIKDEKSLFNIQNYIVNNPTKWDTDENNLLNNI